LRTTTLLGTFSQKVRLERGHCFTLRALLADQNVITDPAIRRDLISSVKYKLTGAIGAENAWIDDTYDKVYAYDSEKIVRVAGMFIHSNGYLVTGNDAVKISFMHFSGVSWCFVPPSQF
jgi:hypothetical protein